MDEISKLMIEQLRDAYSAERQQQKAIPKVVRKLSSPALKEAIQAHGEQSEGQLERLDQALERLGGKSGRKVCEGMRGLIEEMTQELDEHEKGPLLDCVAIAALQRAEHYEIAAYGSIVAMARAAGENEIAELLTATLEEEKQADLKLTEIGEQEVSRAAVASIRGEEEDAEDDEEEGEEEAEAATAERAPAKGKPANDKGRTRRKAS